jgi:hypothetical protein
MPKPVAEWSEDDVLSLPVGENDTFERKGARLLDLAIPGVNEGKVLDELAKQLSAFANTGGGQIIYGLIDAGAVDNGGIARSVRGRQSTKEWLEEVIPTLTDFEVVGFNVYDIQPKATGSSLAPDKSLYVVDVRDSERAPHQSKRDFKYYVRLGGKSRPASHRLIEDIRNRQKHPLLEISSIQLQVASIPLALRSPDNVPIIDGEVRIIFQISLENVGRMMARNTCLRVEDAVISWRGYDPSTVRRRGQASTQATAFFGELIDPIYPGMKMGFWIDARMPACYVPVSASSPFGGPWLIDRKKPADARLSWWLFADNAPVKQGNSTMEDLGFEKAAGICVDKQTNGGVIRRTYPTMP